jgi:endonuclease YncB( thermonuclease family)
MFLRGRAIECFYPHADTAVEITAPCRVGETDLGLWLLDQGWAKPGQYATDEYKAASAAAHCKERGLWRGQPAPEGCVGADSKPQ